MIIDSRHEYEGSIPRDLVVQKPFHRATFLSRFASEVSNNLCNTIFSGLLIKMAKPGARGSPSPPRRSRSAETDYIYIYMYI